MGEVAELAAAEIAELRRLWDAACASDQAAGSNEQWATLEAVLLNEPEPLLPVLLDAAMCSCGCGRTAQSANEGWDKTVRDISKHRDEAWAENERLRARVEQLQTERAELRERLAEGEVQRLHVNDRLQWQHQFSNEYGFSWDGTFGQFGDWAGQALTYLRSVDTDRARAIEGERRWAVEAGRVRSISRDLSAALAKHEPLVHYLLTMSDADRRELEAAIEIGRRFGGDVDAEAAALWPERPMGGRLPPKFKEPPMRFMRKGVKMEFTCPRCGGHCYNSDRREPVRRYCFGPDGVVPGCGYDWDERDDFLYFTLNGKRYAGHASFQAALYVTEPPEVTP